MSKKQSQSVKQFVKELSFKNVFYIERRSRRWLLEVDLRAGALKIQ